MIRRTHLIAVLGALAFALAVVPAQALDNVIYNGSDLWMTPADGSTFAEFKSDPIPAGFFCKVRAVHRPDCLQGRAAGDA